LFHGPPEVGAGRRGELGPDWFGLDRALEITLPGTAGTEIGEIWEIPWEKHGKNMGKTWEIHRKTWEIHGIDRKPWEIHGTSLGNPWKHLKIIEKERNPSVQMSSSVTTRG